ncbi:DUF6252 family protein [Psychroflexus aestuariivivens]|uniref:DUF6252 family protein n=1 Tax=Psychroflexus aestuariivivens TaxID=1795040 RepID=UPI000FDB8CF0|nr:DUF6252 family protein [Psychroflexus aestuariivivens]
MDKIKIFFYSVSLLFFFSCNSDDGGSINPINRLPKATQTGENTFGCLLDGEAFIPGGGINPLDCVYQLINGERFFNVQGNKRDEDNNLERISLSTNAKELQEGQTYQLLTNDAGNLFGAFFLNATQKFTDGEENTGELKITHLDLTNQTISGTFFFDIVDQNGNLREIREGRFDMHFTQ